MIKLKDFSSKLEADFVLQALQSQNIKAEMRGQKEYVSYILGGETGLFSVYIEKNDLAAAQSHLQHLANSNPADPIARTASSYLKRAVIFSAMAAFLLPIVFNIASLMNLKSYLQLEKSLNLKITMLLVIFLLQIPSAITICYLIKIAMT